MGRRNTTLPTEGFNARPDRGFPSAFSVRLIAFACGLRLASDDFHANATGTAHADGSSCPATEVDRATFHERTPIIDPHHYGPAITRVRHSDLSPKAKRPV